jgi:tetratricopeptide (TPR) repeat protein
MSTQFQTPFAIPATQRAKYSPREIAGSTLKLAAAFWFIVVMLGQLIFATSVALFYGLTAARGNWQLWNKFMLHGYTPGRPMGNVVVAIHLASAVIILLSGALQLIPLVRRRAPLFHRWNGRIYMVTAFSVSLAGLYMLWIRGTPGDLSQHLGQTLDALLIMLCSVLALRYALLHDFKAHRRWALRLFMVVSASLFIRAGVFLSLILNHGPFGFDPNTVSGPFLTFMSFGQYLVPLAVLEIYLRTQDRAGTIGRFAMAAGLFALTLGLTAGIVAVTMSVFIPNLKRAFDSRKSIAETLVATIATAGMDAATQQYQQLKEAGASAYNLDEDELNVLGYQLLKANKLEQAIRIFQLNVEAYPNSGNTYDSLAEAYMDQGNKPLAIANYKRSLQLNPANNNAVKRLQKLSSPE